MEWREAKPSPFNTGRGNFSMQRLRGSGNTFSTSGKPWLPFRYNPKIGRQRAKAMRIKRKGLALPEDKASLRAIANQISRPRQ